MSLLDQIQKDMTAAMKASEQTRLDALRMIKTALKKHEIDSMKPLDEPTELQILTTLIKQRREAAEMFRKGNRPELADREEAELKLIESYMPAAPTERRKSKPRLRRRCRDRRYRAKADGHRDESRPGQARGQASGRQGAQ